VGAEIILSSAFLAAFDLNFFVFSVPGSRVVGAAVPKFKLEASLELLAESPEAPAELLPNKSDS
jgi:hypothetical protein